MHANDVYYYITSYYRFDEDFFIDIMFKTIDSEEIDDALVDKSDWSSATDQSLRGRFTLLFCLSLYH